MRICDTRLGHTQEAGQFLGGAILDEVAQHDDPVPLGQQGDGVAEVGVQLPLLELLGRLPLIGIGQHVDEGQLLVLGVTDQVLEGQDDRAEDAVAESVELVAGHAERLGGLTDRGDAPELCGQALLGGVQATGQGSHRAGAQSADRTASMIAPRMRWAAKRLNGTPRASS